MSDRAQHVVLFRFPRELTPEEEQHMRGSIRAWPETIPGFTGLRFGRDVTGRSQGFDYLLLTEFESEEAHRAYYSQPTHVAFSEWVSSMDADIVRVDYPLSEDNLIV